MGMQHVGTLSTVTSNAPTSKRASDLQKRCGEVRASIALSEALDAVRHAALAFVDDVHKHAQGLKAKPLDAMAYRHMRKVLAVAFSEYASTPAIERASLLSLDGVYALMDELKYTTNGATRRSLDLLLDLAYFKAHIGPVTTKAHHRIVNSKSAEPVLRTRSSSAGSQYCKYCASPSARYRAFHSSSVDEFLALREDGYREHDFGDSPIFHDLNPHLCSSHAERDRDSGRDRTAERNLERMREELRQLSTIAKSCGLADLKPLRIRSYVAWIRAKRDVLKREYKAAAKQRLFSVVEPKIQALLLNVFGSLGLPRHWLDVTSSLTQIHFCEDGYFVRVYHDGTEEVFQVASAYELAQWSERSQTVLRRLAPILDVEASTDESWLSCVATLDGVANEVPIGSLSIFSPVQGVGGEIIVTRLGYAFRDIPTHAPRDGSQLHVLLPPGLLNPLPGREIRLTLLSPDWLAGMFSAKRVRLHSP